jgi:hypothetical protein
MDVRIGKPGKSFNISVKKGKPFFSLTFKCFGHNLSTACQSTDAASLQKGQPWRKIKKLCNYYPGSIPAICDKSVKVLFEDKNY